ncbi:MAG: tetratricopeptide repeat protein [Vicinamibacteria bacterium]
MAHASEGEPSALPSILHRAWPALIIVVAGLWAYSSSFSGIFVFDDEPAIAQNQNLQSLWPLSRAMTAPRDTTLAGRPVATLSFAIDHAIYGGALTGYHATNLAIHLSASLLLFGVIRWTLIAAGVAAATSLWQAFTIALLFVVHPLQTGSVTYIVQRVESLMGLLFLATLYASIRSLDAEPARRGLWTAAAILACALGMGTKEVMVSAPLVVMLWDRLFAPRARSSRRVLYGGLMATWLILLGLVLGGYRSSSVGFGFAEWPWWKYLMTQAEILAHYLKLSFIPSPLVLDYEWPAVQSLSQVILQGLLIVSLFLMTIWGVVRRQSASFISGWFFLILAPTSSVLPIVTEVAAEHRMYLPLAAVISAVVLGAAYSLRRLSERIPGLKSGLAVGGPIGIAVIAIIFGSMTRARNLDYQDYDRIWLDTIAKRPNNSRARTNYASSLLTAGRFLEAESHLRVAVENQPDNVEAQANLGVALSAQGKLDDGIDHLQRALTLKPDYAEASRNLGEAYALTGRMGAAVAAYLKALEMLPNDVMLLKRASWILATDPDDSVRDGAHARALAQRAVDLTQSRDADALDGLAAALAEVGEHERAFQTAGTALGIARAMGDSDLARGVESRAALYARGQKFRESAR